MIISRGEIDSAVSAFKAGRRKTSQSAPSVSFDTAALDVDDGPSWQAASFAALAAHVAHEPMYREALVNDLQRRISEDKYDVPSEAIVEKLLGRLVLESISARS